MPGLTHSGERLNSSKPESGQAESHSMDLAVAYIAQDEEKQSAIARSLAPLKSARDVYNYTASTTKELSPLERFSPRAKQQFLRSLRFNDNGLTTFDYTVLESLSPSEIYKVISLFGLQSGAHRINTNGNSEVDSLLNTPSLRADDFLEGYRCEGRGTCGTSQRNACTSNC